MQENILYTYIELVQQKIENFKRRIGITEKSHKTRRDCWGGNVNHRSDSLILVSHNISATLFE